MTPVLYEKFAQSIFLRETRYVQQKSSLFEKAVVHRLFTLFSESSYNTQENTRVTSSVMQHSVDLQLYYKRDLLEFFSCKLTETSKNFQNSFFSDKLLATVSAHQDFVFIYDWRKENVYVRYIQDMDRQGIAAEQHRNYDPRLCKATVKLPQFSSFTLNKQLLSDKFTLITQNTLTRFL